MLSYLEPLAADFKNNSNPAYAVKMQAYLKDKFVCFGIKTPLRKEIINKFLLTHGTPGYRDLKDLVSVLFELPEREFHYTAIEFCCQTKPGWTKETIDLFESIALTKSWWDSVDSLNSNCLRPFFLTFPEGRYKTTGRWTKSRNIWLQRLSIIFQLRYKEKTDLRLLERNITRLAGSEEFFVKKAIGWALRDYAFTDPEWVIDFAGRIALHPLSHREALKHLK